MKKVLHIICTCLFVPCVLFSCGNEPNKKTTAEDDLEATDVTIKSNNLNISFLLDLSDRINPTKYPNPAMEYYVRDVAYIKSVSEALDAHLRRKKVRAMNDKIQLFFEPEPLNKNINSISNSLKYSISRDNASLELLDKLNEIYTIKPKEIYDLAIADNEYVGSDTWRFFKTKVHDYCIEDGYRNILIILTDGYIYHKDSKMKEGNLTTYITPQEIRTNKLNTKDWRSNMASGQYGFIPATKDLSSLEILVLGINPDKKNPYEEDVIMKYWKDWFNAMNVGRYEIKTAELPSNLDRIIKDFVLDK
jgi:hypothetical protein